MMAFDTELARFNMIEQQIRPWDVLDKRVLAALAHIPREQFVAPEQRNLAFSDLALPIGQGETMLPPVVEGRLLQAANPQPQERVLEIGTGSGFFTACLAHLARSVVSVEIHPEFTARASERLAELGITNVLLETGDAARGWAPNERFDVILLTGAVAELPDAFRQQLTIGGRLVAIVGHEPIMSAVRVTRLSEVEFKHETLFETHTRYLQGAAPRPSFQFN
ncbi:protein-L-isoaspartate O-methyltransferase family protein [Halothiobacillus sp. DCM-1]|uniref:protein-L-isoaspartate O-methyltransferase family protein n=1 Tax=Halothiobacillus sp. DCM-1 TaxID=3112558 RepID=UPI00325000AD